MSCGPMLCHARTCTPAYLEPQPCLTVPPAPKFSIPRSPQACTARPPALLTCTPRAPDSESPVWLICSRSSAPRGRQSLSALHPQITPLLPQPCFAAFLDPQPRSVASLHPNLCTPRPLFLLPHRAPTRPAGVADPLPLLGHLPGARPRPRPRLPVRPGPPAPPRRVTEATAAPGPDRDPPGPTAVPLTRGSAGRAPLHVPRPRSPWGAGGRPGRAGAAASAAASAPHGRGGAGRRRK